MSRLRFAIPGDIATVSGGYGYDRRLLAELPACGVDAVHLPLPGNFPHPSERDVADTMAALSGTGPILIDGLALGALPATALDALPASLIALCHHPLCLETGLEPARRDALFVTERDALARAAHVIVTSGATAGTLIRDFGVPETKITVALPGTDRAPRSAGSSEVPQLLAVGSIIPRKGFDVLVEALSGLTDLNWHLRIAGSMDTAPATTAALLAQIAGCGLAGRIDCVGSLGRTELDALYHRSDIFVSASHYEGYGMALTEALARGLPILTTTGGASGETIPREASLQVAPGDPVALRAALHRLLIEPDLRAALSEAAWSAGSALPTWTDTARRIAAIVLQVAERSQS